VLKGRKLAGLGADLAAAERLVYLALIGAGGLSTGGSGIGLGGSSIGLGS
jgi:hypothetical protein